MQVLVPIEYKFELPLASELASELVSELASKLMLERG